jgi:hypothetical protein
MQSLPLFAVPIDRERGRSTNIGIALLQRAVPCFLLIVNFPAHFSDLCFCHQHVGGGSSEPLSVVPVSRVEVTCFDTLMSKYLLEISLYPQLVASMQGGAVGHREQRQQQER